MRIGPCIFVINEEEEPTRCYLVFYYTYERLNKFRAALCPSSGAHNYTSDYHMEVSEIVQKALKETFITLQNEAEKLGLIINTNKTKYMKLTGKTKLTKQDMEVIGTSYEAVNQFIYLGSQINSKNLIQEEYKQEIEVCLQIKNY
jgi:hypothetical protein